MRKLTTTQGQNRRHSCFCKGGPWDGKKITLRSDGDGKTTIIKIGTWKGYYNRGFGKQYSPFIWYSTIKEVR